MRKRIRTVADKNNRNAVDDAEKLALVKAAKSKRKIKRRGCGCRGRRT